ncbi:MAG: alpha/beta fold hydrolase [Bryobacteraceae bacterium]
MHSRRAFLAAALPVRSALTKRMEQVMGEFPQTPRGALEIEKSEPLEMSRHSHIKLSYASEAGDRVPAYLLLPHGLHSKAPAMLCLHQTTRIGKDEPAALGGKPNLHYAAELADLGFVTLAPDYPNFGEYQFDAYTHGYASTTMKAIWNHSRAVDLLESLPQVRRDAIGCIGHSLGGHNTLFLASFDSRVRALVTSCGFTSFHKYMHGDLTGWSHKGYMPRIAERYGKDPARMPFDFPELLAALAPRALFVNAPLRDSNFDVDGVRECVAAFRGKHLEAVYPDAEHDFPPAARNQAYRFLQRYFKMRVDSEPNFL